MCLCEANRFKKPSLQQPPQPLNPAAMSEPTPTVEVSGPSDDSGGKADLTPYRVLAVDGTELLVNLPPDASVYDCCLAVAGMKRLAVSQVRLIAGGEPLVCTRARALREVCGAADLMMASWLSVVASSSFWPRSLSKD